MQYQPGLCPSGKANRRLTWALSALALLAVTTLNTQAQSIYGSLRGLVTDAQGAAVANAKITMTDEGTSVSRSTVTSTSGEFSFASVTPATYAVTTESPGFKKFERRGVIVATQQSVTVDIVMEVGQVTESVLVTEEVPLIETANASQGQVVDRQKLVDLPNLGRNPYLMSKIAPNVIQVGQPAYNRMQDQSGSSQISLAGGPVRGNNYLIDGIPITDMTNRAIVIASLEAVQEMKVQANTYDAEIGRSGGGMFNVYLKSGTNDYHGSLQGSMRQTDWLANNFFSNRSGLPVSEQPNRTYLGSFGGPVWIPKIYNGKNRTFFWLGFEGYRDTQANTTNYYTPTALERIGDFSQTNAQGGGLQTIYDPMNLDASGKRIPFTGNVIPTNRIDTVGRNVAATYAMPQTAGRYWGDNNVAAAATLPSKADQKFIKIDHKLTEWWTANISYLKYNSIEPGQYDFRNVSSPNQWFLDRRVDSTQVNSTMTLNPTTILAVRYGFNRFPNYGYQASQGFNPAQLGFAPSFTNSIASNTFPNFTMQQAYSLGTNNNFNYVHHSKNLSGTLSKFMGRHSLKFGADYRLLHLDGSDFGNSSGAFTFNDVFTRQNGGSATAGTGADIASLLLGYPSDGNGFLTTKLYEYSHYSSVFVQDDFRMNAKLTINFGLRWERETGLAESNNLLITGFDRNATNPLSVTAGIPVKGAVQYAGQNGAKTTLFNPTMNKLSPRIGVAYQLNSKTTIRGGYGIFWAPQNYFGSPFLSEGVTAQTLYVASNDGNVTPNTAISLSNPFPNGLVKPAGNTLGASTGLGKALTIVDPNAKSGMVQQFSIDVQRELPGNVALSVAYVGSRSRNLTFNSGNININQVEPAYYGLGEGLRASVPNPYYGKGGTGVIGSATITQAQLLRPFNAFGNILYAQSGYGKARYDSLAVRAQKRFSQGMTFVAAWTYSKNLDNVSGGAGNFLNAGNQAPQNTYNLGSEWGLANIQSPHRFTFTGTYELPFGKGKSFLGSANYATNLLIGGWSLNAIGIIQTGYPIQIYQNSNNNSVIFASSQRPNTTGTSPETSGALGDRLNSYINPAAFSQAPAFTFGNVSRTLSMRGPGQVNWDLSVFKSFSVTERLKAQFRAEALNAMNTPQFRGPNGAWGNANFGRIVEQANFARMIQLGVRVSF